MPHKINRFVYWTPRVLSILFILLLALFSLDVFDGNYSFWGTILSLLIHNIPSFILTAILIISWKREIVGGITFILAGLLYLIFFKRNPFEWYYLLWVLPISGTAFFIGILFLIGWRRRKKDGKNLTSSLNIPT